MHQVHNEGHLEHPVESLAAPFEEISDICYHQDVPKEDTILLVGRSAPISKIRSVHAWESLCDLHRTGKQREILLCRSAAEAIEQSFADGQLLVGNTFIVYLLSLYSAA
ncbi:hypothetical protein TNCV_4780061 [Trichonephila clavipes]|nr:hypothetical protein TNCV_4780061 [Trichonephila clavipes]